MSPWIHAIQFVSIIHHYIINIYIYIVPIYYIHTYIHTYTHTHIHTYIHTYVHIYIHTYTYTYIHTYMHAYTYTHTHTHTHTYIHTYIHVVTLNSQLYTYVAMYKVTTNWHQGENTFICFYAYVFLLNILLHA